MKKIILYIVSVVLITSCSTETTEPIDEITGKGHDNWTKVSFIFTEGEVSTSERFHFKGYKNDESLHYKTVQQYSFELVAGQVKASGTPIKLVKGLNYGLEIRYYNGSTLINYQFATEEMAPIHQHFFITNPIPGTVKQTEKNVIDYVYRDTSPVDMMITEENVYLRASDDPIGLKGYFKVFEKPETPIDLQIILVHVIAGTKLDHNGKAYPFYAPSNRIIGTRDLSVKIPIEVFSDKSSNSFVEDVSTTFNISKLKAQQEINNRVQGNLKL